MSDKANRTEQPTPRRLERAHKEGNLPVSREFVSAITLLCFVWLLDTYSVESYRSCRRLFTELLELSANHLTLADAHAIMLEIAFRSMRWPVVFGLMLVGATVTTHLATTKAALRWGMLRPDLKRLNSLARVSQMPAQNLRAAFIAVVLLAGCTYFISQVMVARLTDADRMTSMDLNRAISIAGHLVMRLLWVGSSALFVLGCADLFRQRRKWWEQLRMTKQEVREEHKEMEGNPMIRQRIRRLQRELTRQRMMQEVPAATAVVVNPTHYAVALRYNLAGAGAPKVVAKGQNWLALRIRELAVRHQIPIIENAPLARALYSSAEVGQEIPAELYQAVAEVLAYIYRLLDGRLPGGEKIK